MLYPLSLMQPVTFCALNPEFEPNKRNEDTSTQSLGKASTKAGEGCLAIKCTWHYQAYSEVLNPASALRMLAQGVK